MAAELPQALYLAVFLPMTRFITDGLYRLLAHLEVGYQTFVSRLVLSHDDDRQLDGGMIVQQALDFAEFDAVPAAT